MTSATSSAADYLPQRLTLASLMKAAATCRGCPLFRDATQTVFGAGRRESRLVLVGEQPGDAEDKRGAPFVGPAGRVLDDVLAIAGIERDAVYVTNAVKHFKWEPRGKRRIHKRPTVSEIERCRPWLRAEIEIIRPDCVVALGATAARALMQKAVTIKRDRGRLLRAPEGFAVVVAHHPSVILRAPEREERAALREDLVADLRSALKTVH